MPVIDLFLQAIYSDMHVPLKNRFWISSPSFFKVTFSFPKWRSLKPWKGHLWVQNEVTLKNLVFFCLWRNPASQSWAIHSDDPKIPLGKHGKVPFLLKQLWLLLGVASCWKLTATAVFQAQQSVTMWQIICWVRTTTTSTITTITQTWCLWQIFFWQIQHWYGIVYTQHTTVWLGFLLGESWVFGWKTRRWLSILVLNVGCHESRQHDRNHSFGLRSKGAARNWVCV